MPAGSMSAPRVAVVGGGVGASALVFGLRNELATRQLEVAPNGAWGRLPSPCCLALTVPTSLPCVDQVELFEMGRGPGGRATTRGTRERPELRVDHGAPSFAARSARFGALCEELAGSGGALQHSDELVGILDTDGSFVAEEQAPTRYVGRPGHGMSSLCEALLRGGQPSAPMLAKCSFGTMVSQVERVDAATHDGACAAGSGTRPAWRLRSNKGNDLGLFDWLVVTSTGLAHPRWTSAFGGPPPLVDAAATMNDANLSAALDALAPLTSKPVTSCLLAYTSEAAAAWAALPFRKARVAGDGPLSRIVVQRLAPSLTAVVLHSTHDFSREVASVYGATSTAARLAGAASDAQTEAQVLDEMRRAATARLSGLLSSEHLDATPVWGPHLHRWGAAFPDAPLLPSQHTLVRSAGVAFCGDFVEGEGAGSVEGAALSGLRLSEQLRSTLQL